VRGAYQSTGRILTSSEAARIAGADVTADEAAALLKQMPNATIDEIVALLEAG
jgi:hypothetical protein